MWLSKLRFLNLSCLELIWHFTFFALLIYCFSIQAPLIPCLYIQVPLNSCLYFQAHLISAFYFLALNSAFTLFNNIVSLFQCSFMFLPVDSIAFIRLRRSHAQVTLLSFVPFFDQTPEITRTKGALEVVCTPKLKSV